MTKDQDQVIAQVQLQIKPGETVDEEKIKMLKSFKATKLQILFKLILPANTFN